MEIFKNLKELEENFNKDVEKILFLNLGSKYKVVYRIKVFNQISSLI